MRNTVIESMAQDLLECLFHIDQSATTKSGDLSSYKEKDLWPRVCQWLQKRKGAGTVNHLEANREYPTGRGQYDLWLNWDNASLYVEGKGAWKTYWIERGSPSKFRSYLLPPLVNDVALDDKSAALDLQKLVLSTPADATAIAQILFGSAKPKHSISSDMDEYARLARLDSDPWTCWQRRWQNHQWPDYEYDVRIFVCAFGDIPGWWKTIEHYPWP